MGSLKRQLGWKIGVLLSAVLLLVMVSLSVGDCLWQRYIFLGELRDHIAEEAWTVAILLEDISDPAERQQLLTQVAQGLNEGEQHGRHHEVFILDNHGVVQASNNGEADQSVHALRGSSGYTEWRGNLCQRSDAPW